MRRRTAPASRAQLALSFDALPAVPAPRPAPLPLPPPAPALPVDPLAAALARHAAIESALRSGGPNPLPDELTDSDWEEHLAAFQSGGPYDCALLQDAEAAVEILVEMLPDPGDADQDDSDEPLAPAWTGLEPGEQDPWDDYLARGCPAVEVYLPEDPEPHADPESPAPPDPTQAACLRIYRESLPDLREDELHVDLAAALDAGREDTAALITAELKRRERETPSPAFSVT